MHTRVTISPDEIRNFRKSWPCSGLPLGVSLTGEYATNGDLTGYEWSDGDDHWDAECSGAMQALLNDAQSGKIGTRH